MTASTWTRISPSTLADQAYRAVRDRILDGKLPPGAFVREQDLSAALGVSRTPVREALGRLASEGFLERIPHRGFRVPADAVSRLVDLYPIVSTLELLAGRLAFPHVRATDIDRLRALNARLATAMRSGDVEDAIASNEAFHSVIDQLSGNDPLNEMLSDLRIRLRVLERWYYSSPTRGEQSVREHGSLIAALETGQIDRALAIFEHNMALTMTSLRDERHTERELGNGIRDQADQ